MLTNPHDAFRGQSTSSNKSGQRSLTIIGNVTIRQSVYDFVFCSNYGCISCRFGDIWCQKMSWPWNLGQWSLKVIESAIIRSIGNGFLLVFFSNFDPKTHHFRHIWLQKHRDLENRVRSPSRSLEMSPFNRAHTTSYWRSIVTIAQTLVVSEIFNVV